MDKLKMHTPNLVEENIEKIAAMFPNAVTERIIGYKEEARTDGTHEPIMQRAIDFDVLRQELSGIIVEGPTERYTFTWPDKRKSVLAANAPIAKTMRPCREESVDFDATENLYIEGDNLDALKLMLETYLGRIKMIYIDPPYNTGNDFVYDDDFAESVDAYMERSGDYDSEGNRLVQNTESSGRFHTDWLNMMYPRLRFAKDLLSEDGAIFISIDDNEVANLVKMCDEIFGQSSRIALICHKSRASVSNDKIISPNHNIILFYAKNSLVLESFRKMIGLDPNLDGFDFDDNDGRGAYRLVPVDGPGGAKKGNPHFNFLGVEGYWRFSLETMKEKYDQGLVIKKGKSIYQKYYRSTATQTRRTATTWWDDVSLISTATSKLKALMNGSAFDTPKPVELIDRMLRLITHSNTETIVLDFFSGSATTAHAVMQLNAEDGGHRKFIMVQLPEPCDEKSEAYKAGYRNICEIGKERIRRAGAKIKADSPLTTQDLDVGFRVLKIDSSNMRDVYYAPEDVQPKSLLDMAENIKSDRTPEDLLFQVMLDLGILLSSKIEEMEIAGKKMFSVADDYLIACFDDAVTDETVKAIAQRQPYYAVFRDSGFKSDSIAANFEQIFETYSSSTIRKVL